MFAIILLDSECIEIYLKENTGDLDNTADSRLSVSKEFWFKDLTHFSF